jgi:ArsR family transcriptional regulator
MKAARGDYSRVFRAFSDENRVRVLELLCGGEQCACVLLDDLDISQPTLSHHMRILCESGLVKSRRVGRWHYYSIDAEGCAYAGSLLGAIVRRDMGGVLKFARRAHKALGLVRAVASPGRLFGSDPSPPPAPGAT